MLLNTYEHEGLLGLSVPCSPLFLTISYMNSVHWSLCNVCWLNVHETIILWQLDMWRRGPYSCSLACAAALSFPDIRAYGLDTISMNGTTLSLGCNQDYAKSCLFPFPSGRHASVIVSTSYGMYYHSYISNAKLYVFHVLSRWNDIHYSRLLQRDVEAPRLKKDRL